MRPMYTHIFGALPLAVISLIDLLGALVLLAIVLLAAAILMEAVRPFVAVESTSESLTIRGYLGLTAVSLLAASAHGGSR